MRLQDKTISQLGGCAATVGKADFYFELLGVISSIVAWDMRMVMRYSDKAAPEYVLADDVPANQMAMYLSNYYRLDPFFEYWRVQRRAGVVHMREFKVARKMTTAYFKVFQPQTGMRDGLGVFLPSFGTSAIALCLERQTSFTGQETRKLTELLPILIGLNTSHERTIAASLTAKQLMQDDALEGLSHLGADFDVTPEGEVLIVEGRTALPPFDIEAASRNFLKDELTRRERQIVGLVVRGCSSYEVACKLQISEGTVKNHRKRLYKKLKIVSERDLLARFIEHLTTQ